jgi:hypothetical protein
VVYFGRTGEIVVYFGRTGEIVVYFGRTGEIEGLGFLIISSEGRRRGSKV